MANLKRPPVFREDGTVEIRLTQGYTAIIDIEDAHLAQFNWCAGSTRQRGKGPYAVRNAVPGERHHRLHCVIMNASGDHQVDHRDGNTLNCRRSNLRVVTPKENARNRKQSSRNKSGMCGVWWDRRTNMWQVRLGTTFLGYFHAKEDAIACRLEAERREWGVQPQRTHLHE